ncbi:hypothetical protein H1R20_g7976, partial [Candolleomyces eurysporus]
MASLAPTSNATYTVAELMRALESMGVNIQAPGAVNDLPASSMAATAAQEAVSSTNSQAWTVLRSSSSDLILVGPAGTVPIPEVVQALVDCRATAATGVYSYPKARMYLLTFTDQEPARRASERWYCVATGLEVGVFQGSTIASSYTVNVRGARMEGFNTKEEAEAAFEKAKAAGAVRKVRCDDY